MFVVGERARAVATLMAKKKTRKRLWYRAALLFCVLDGHTPKRGCGQKLREYEKTEIVCSQGARGLMVGGGQRLTFS